MNTSPAVGTEVLSEALTESDPLIGQPLGVYRLVRELGRGGMGAVYLAERADDEFEQRVAIKLIKRGMDSDEIVRRFRQERQILAQLSHPHIARLLDGGTTPDGRPYFVMDYVEGESLYVWCDTRQLGLRERVALFQQVCAAVDYAHHQRVIHRDLKPSNLLVSREDGAVRLLDFGIARLLVTDPEGDTLTLTGERLLTPHYASPEQVRGLTLTFASDVYSLGLVLYELLTGRRPYVLSGQAWHEISRAVCETNPAPPSQVVWNTSGALMVNGESASVETISNLRKHTPSSLGATLAGSLDNVVMKALRKDPQERYATAAELSEDLVRWLHGDEVRAVDPLATARIVAKKDTGELDKPALQRLAVLPFKLLSAPTENYADEEFLRIGLADSLIARLSRLDRITVRPTSSVLRFQSAADPLAAARELNVQLVLDGLIRRAGTRMRLSVQLLDVNAGTTLWAEQFDESVTDVLTLEDTLSTRVAEAILPQLSRGERQRLAKRGTDNFEAYEAYLRGRYYWNQFTPDGLAQALTHYQRAIELDPNYALAYVGIAIYYHWLGLYSIAPPMACMPTAREAARKALELDDQLAEGYAALSLIALFYDCDLAEAERYERRAMELDAHNPMIRLWRSYRWMLEKRFDESLTEAALVLELDPQAPLARLQVCTVLYFARRYEEGVLQYRATIAANPQDALPRLGLSFALTQLQRYDEAIAEIEQVLPLVGDVPVYQVALGAALARRGSAAAAREIVAQLESAAATRYVAPGHFALLHAALGDTDKAFEKLEESLAQRDTWLILTLVEPMFDAMRSDERFVSLLQRMQLSAV
ncbi:MAG: protein kinase [Acidobacteria bacterium]|nr:protein kinase [Acidobacteriota bacterium]